jgi:1-acyl-sn-glycerol-3-phosphate acyltransferase
MIYLLGWSFFLALFKMYLGFKIVGGDNIPKDGAFIFVSNHVSYLDPILLGTSNRRNLYYMARENLFKRPMCGWVMRKLHAFPVKRNEGDAAAIKQALRILGSGKPLVIFPEGTRSKDRSLRPAKPGTGFIVSKAKVPVVPAYIEGSFDALPRGLDTLKRHCVKVYIGKPLFFDETRLGRKGRESYQSISDEIMKSVARLKDENNAG